MGVDQMGVDEMGSRRSGNKPSSNMHLISFAAFGFPTCSDRNSLGNYRGLLEARNCRYLCLPPLGLGDILFLPGRPSVGPSVLLSVCLSVCLSHIVSAL